MDVKGWFVEELMRVYEKRIGAVVRAERDAAEAADQTRAEATRREDRQDADQQARLARSHGQRRRRAAAEIRRLRKLAKQGLPRFGRGDRVGLGALVDVRIEDEAGAEERTLLCLPVGAGEELTGPGGDGFVVVVTPESPVGRALLGARVGDSFEIVIDGRDREWTVVDLA